MRLHILGICGTFMAGLAAIAQEAGHTVSGSDEGAWPPMSTQLEKLGIRVRTGYSPQHLEPAPDLVVIGNALSRGNLAVEHVLNAGLPYVSGPQWLAEHVLSDRHVLAVAGTHGKTTTASMLAHILDRVGLEPGFLVGGLAVDLGVSARLGRGRCFVVEADEYDTAFFDKRSKFVHYHPRTLVLNNLEYDHADIFPDLPSIERQFHYLIRTVPGNGRILVNGGDANLARVLGMGCWTPVGRFDVGSGRYAADWGAEPRASGFELLQDGQPLGFVRLRLHGDHNRANALAAVAAATDVDVEPADALAALRSFSGVKRRLERRGEVNGIVVYDDFAHHPTAVEATLAALRESSPSRILSVLEPRSNTMRLGIQAQALARSLKDSDLVFLYVRPDLSWDPTEAFAPLADRVHLHNNLPALVTDIAKQARTGDAVLLMSNGDFGGLPERLLAALAGS